LIYDALASGYDAGRGLFDNNGNTQTKVVGSSTTTYAWDFENRLTSVMLPGTGGTVSFRYDPFGRRVQKSFTTGANPPTTTTTNYLYDGDNGIEEVDANGSVLARYSQGLNFDDPLAMLRGGATNYYHADGLGSVTSLSNSTGALAQSYTYDSFGKQTAASGSLTNPFRYTGRESDVETGLYYYRARYYDPNVGRFLTEDPIRFTGGFDFYSYVGNSPIDIADPVGLFGTRDGITRHQAVDIDPSCGTRSGGACTLFRAALVLCTCTTDGCDGKWKANAVDSNGNAIARYMYSKAVDEPLAQLRSGTTSYYEADGLGSVTSLSSTAGAVAQTYTFDSFGNTTNSAGSLTNRFQYTGREFDSETNLYFYRSRYYDPKAGRFIGEDTIRFNGGINFYNYVQGNPTNYRDPSGEIPVYGWWCGPNWTGGHFAPYDPKLDNNGYYKKPINPTDAVCRDHDICYWSCRDAFPCDQGARGGCMRNCDARLIYYMPTTGAGPIIGAAIDFFNEHPDAGKNDPKCPNCKK